MKIQVLSDLHLEFTRFCLKKPAADLVVLAGDIANGTAGFDWAMRRFKDVPVVMVLGNHDYYYSGLPALSETLARRSKSSNVRVLENAKFEHGGVTFFGCTFWTDFNFYGTWVRSTSYSMDHMSDFKQDLKLIKLTGPNEDPRHPCYLTPYDSCGIHAESLAWLKKEIAATPGPKVVVTHHPPASPSADPAYAGNKNTPGFVSRHDDFVRDSGVDLWIHGHVHRACDYRLGNTRVLCNPRGYGKKMEPKTGFVPDLVVEVG